MATGIGYDSHRFAHPGPLVLGGVTIESDVRLAGHSDGDVVCHAIIDAMLGAAAAGDIGELFPDSDPAYRGANSLDLLARATQHVGKLGWRLAHADVVVVTESPKLAPHRTAMRERLARAIGVSPDRISVKAKTNEGMGWIGRNEGMACIAVATLEGVSEGAGPRVETGV